MENTIVRAEFILTGGDFDPSDITDILEVTPTESGKKGDMTKNYRVPLQESFWQFDTGDQISLDINEQLSILFDLFFPKKVKILELQRSYDLFAKICLVVVVEDHQPPAIYLDKKMIQFMAEFQLELDVDLYVNPSNSTEE